MADAAATALDYINRAASLTLLATLALLAWVASGVEFYSDGLRLVSMACLTASVVFGVGALALIPLVQEARKPGQSNFEVEVRYMLFGRRGVRLRAVLLPQYGFLLAGVVLFAAGMVD
jgi:hypothetical protein